MEMGFWGKRFGAALGLAFVVIGGAQVLKSRDWSYAATQGAVWAVITAAVYTGALAWQLRRGRRCALRKRAAEREN